MENSLEMNVRMLRTFLAILSVTLSGCAAFTADLITQEKVGLEIIPSDERSYLGVTVTQKGTITTISGAVSLNVRSAYGPIDGHMDVVAVSASEEQLFIAHVPHRRAHPSRFRSHAKFEVSAYMLLPNNPKVILMHHDAPMDVHQPLVPVPYGESRG